MSIGPWLRAAFFLGLLVCAACLAGRGVEEPRTPARFWTDRPNPRPLTLPTEEEDSFRFVVFGDRTGGPAEGIAVLREAVQEVNLNPPDFVMTVGDLIQGYNTTPDWLTQAAEYKDAMDDLACPWFPVAGNHDVYWRGPDAERPVGEHEANYERHFGPLWYAFRHKGSVFVVLYTDEGDPETGRRSFNDPQAQRMSPAQTAWLQRTLERAHDAQHVFVFLHHPRWLGDGYGEDWKRVHELLAEAGNVRAVFAGHIHRMRYDGERDGIEYFTLATVGGYQSGIAPQAGFLHHYEYVTVREEGIQVASYPVGSAFDARSITGELSEEISKLDRTIRPRVTEPLELDADLSALGEVSISLQNPSSRPIEVTFTPQSTDRAWSFRPDHHHARIEAGQRVPFAFDFRRSAGGTHGDVLVPRVDLTLDSIAQDRRIRLRPRSFPLLLEPKGIRAPQAPEQDQALWVDGTTGHARVEHNALDLPDGPFTIECWMFASEFRSRQGLLCKTESAEYGLFTNDGKPEFLVHLDRRYESASPGAPVLEPERWHHVAGVFSGSELRLYVDGRCISRTAGSGQRTRRTVPFLIGADVGGDGSANSHFVGAIDEVRVSTVARYDGDFTPVQRHVPDEHTWLYLAMDERYALWTWDASPGQRHPLLDPSASIAPREAQPDSSDPVR